MWFLEHINLVISPLYAHIDILIFWYIVGVGDLAKQALHNFVKLKF